MNTRERPLTRASVSEGGQGGGMALPLQKFSFKFAKPRGRYSLLRKITKNLEWLALIVKRRETRERPRTLV